MLLAVLFIIPVGAQQELDPAAPPDFPEEARYYFDAPKAKLAEPITQRDTLKFVHILYRHGDRAPSMLLPNDPNNGASSWPNGLSELTPKGIQQHHRLGKWLRNRYDTFLGKNFSRKDIYVRSSDYPRTIMSAQANLAGMFPTSLLDASKPDDWIPIPIHTVDKDRDIQLNEQLKCPNADAALNAMNDDPKVHEIEEAHKDLLKYLEIHSGVKKPLRLRGMWAIFDALNCEDTHKWPDWMNATIWGRVQTLYDQSSQFIFHNKQLRKLRGGALVAEIFERLQAKRNGTLDAKGPTKVYVYSAHDTTLAAFLSTFGIVPHVFPLYASTVILEMHNIAGQDIVEIYSKNVTDSGAIYQMEIPSCPAPCEVDFIKERLKEFYPTDWYAECGRPNSSSTIPLWAIIFTLLMTNILCLAVICVDVIIRRQSSPRLDPRRLLEEKLIADEEEDML
ncbi:unnamed protein product, partial [Mesorhabditis spiculigera]